MNGMLPDNGGSALDFAMSLRSIQSVNVLIKAGADVNATGGVFGTGLSFASAIGNVEMVSMMLKAGCDVNTTNNGHFTPLICAADGVHVEVIKSLIEVGADVNLTDDKGYTALMTAARPQRKEYVRLLNLLRVIATSFGEDETFSNHVEGEACECPCCIVIKHNTGAVEIVQCLEMLIKAGARVNDSARKGETALLFSASEGYANAVELLLKTGAGVNIPANNGITPLMLAANSCVRPLLKAGAVVDSCDSRGWTALMYAAKLGRKECVSLLMQAGADVNNVLKAQLH